MAALVGLAPHTHESGKKSGHAKTGHGRPLVRSALFNAARAAIRHPCPMRAFYARLVEANHRPGKVASTAVMRQIPVIANALLKANRTWTPKTARPKRRLVAIDCRAMRPPPSLPSAPLTGRVSRQWPRARCADILAHPRYKTRDRSPEPSWPGIARRETGVLPDAYAPPSTRSPS
ncbi:MAG TPA: transposase [Roseiarcus sp.]|nr:transposase [Roseiarcus sp.]